MENIMAKKKEESKHYIDNKQFLAALVEYKKEVNRAKRHNEERPQVPDYIGDCFIKIANHLAYKSNFINYSFREDMILDAIENCLIYMDNFDPKKSSNPFAYFTQITYYAFLRRIQKEKKHLQTKYRYIESLDIEGIIRQAHDEGSYDNGFIKYLKQQADAAQLELSETKKDKKMTRKPKYLQKLEDDMVIDETQHIDVLSVDESVETGEIEYE
jgi:DNA-directed RNA polymerase specialized sigma24 family protein